MADSFEVLNEILKGEHMAINTYQAYIDELPSSPLRNHLVGILTDHKKHASRISYFVQTNGGHVKEGIGITGSLQSIKTQFKNLGENKPINMLEELYSGEDKGLARAVQLSENHLSGSEKELLEQIFSDEHDHLKQLKWLKEDLLQ